METSFSGTHISARLDKHTVSVRNCDNICSTTIATGKSMFKAEKAWTAFMEIADKSMSFTDAEDFFNKQGLPLTVKG
jgi:hypothetical protein